MSDDFVIPWFFHHGLPVCDAAWPALWGSSVVETADVYEFTRLETLRDAPWGSAALVAVVVFLVAYNAWMYHREARTISRPKGIVLALLRTVVIAGLVVFFLGLEKRSSSELVEPSRTVLLVDTSLSMQLPGMTSPEVSSTATTPATTRSEQALALVGSSPLVEQLTKSHQVDLVAFGEVTRPIAELPQVRREGHASGTSKTTDPEGEHGELFGKDSPLDLAVLAEQFAPSGHETRLGDALQATLDRYRGLPLAGVIVLSDGGQNRGVDPLIAAQGAAAAGVPLHTVALGPTVAPANVAVRELIAPERAYLGDTLTLQAVIHAVGMAGEQLNLELYRRLIADTEGEREETAAQSSWQLIATLPTTVASDDQLQTERLEVPPGDPGRYLYEVRVEPARGESREEDNLQQAEVIVVEQKTSVLLIAGGPCRDYRFLRNQLQRDDSFTLDVWLQTGPEGISQDANQILFQFPPTPQDLAKYDAIVAFDPDWSALTPEQVEWLEQWVAQQAGGLVLIPGVVNMPRWSMEGRLQPLRGLYPVRLADQFLDLRSASLPRNRPQQLQWTREGQQADFLWLEDDYAENVQAWQTWPGVYGAFGHRGAKPGATVYAAVEPVTGEGAQRLAYLASQYYGAGRVFYIGSSELWRLRELELHYFVRFWTQLLRQVSGGRLLQGSPRGKLLVAQDRYEVGATVALRAVLLNQQMQPLQAASLPVSMTTPSGKQQELTLALEGDRVGNFAGDFRVEESGVYRVTLPIPESSQELSRTIRVAVPQLEIRQTIRDELTLRRLAELTGGHYYQTSGQALEGNGTLPSLVAALPSQARSRRVLGSIDQPFAQQQAFVLLAIVAGALFVEWILRRWSYLA